MKFQSRPVTFASQSGCFLPFLIVFNLIFGWIFFGALTWFLVEVILVGLFLLSLAIIARRFSKFVASERKIIDVEGYPLENNKEGRSITQS